MNAKKLSEIICNWNKYWFLDLLYIEDCAKWVFSLTSHCKQWRLQEGQCPLHFLSIRGKVAFVPSTFQQDQICITTILKFKINWNWNCIVSIDIIAMNICTIQHNRESIKMCKSNSVQCIISIHCNCIQSNSTNTENIT